MMIKDIKTSMCRAHICDRFSHFFLDKREGEWKSVFCFYAAFLILCLFATTARAQKKFFNLTADEVKIDTMLPRFSYSVPLGENFADSVYEVKIKYPEFIDISRKDLEKYQKIVRKEQKAMLDMADDGLSAYLQLAQNNLKELPDVERRIVVDRKKGKLELSFVPVVKRKGKYQMLVSFMIDITSKPVKRSAMKAKARASVVTADRYAGHSVLATGRWVKIRIPANGVYQLTNDLLRRAGFSNPDRVKIYGYGGNLQNEKLVGSELAELDDLKEVATCTVNGRRLFYGKGPVSYGSPSSARRIRNPYSDYGYYFLTESDGEPLTVDETEFLNSFYPANDDYYSLYEVDNFAWFRSGRNLFESTPIAQGKSKTYIFPNKQGAKNRQIKVALTSGTLSSAGINVNGKDVGEMFFSATGNSDTAQEIIRSYSVSGNQIADTVTVTCQPNGPLRMDYILVTYDEPRPAPDFASGTFPVPEYVYAITNQDLHSHGPADMVIIIPTSQKLLAQAQRLADFHAEHDGLRVRIVPADELYNEFSSGTPDANAYRRYMKMLYDRAETDADMPKSLLLFGGCLWDNRMLTEAGRTLSPDDYLLAFESENSFSHTDSYINDGFFALLDDGEGTNMLQGDKEDIGIGRFPVVLEADAKTMVDKSINYMSNKNAGDWQNVVMFMGDDGDNDLHMKDANTVADAVAARYPSLLVKKVMWDAYKRETSITGNSYPEVERQIKRQQAEGALVMDYAGHGGPGGLSHEMVLSLNDFTGFTNANLPLWITAACDVMPYDQNIQNIGEAAVLNNKGGAVAFFGTTRTVYASYNASINNVFMKHVLSVIDGKPITLGEAQRLTKNELITTSLDRTANKLQYALLGDPALSLNLPTLRVVIDSINKFCLADGDMPVLKAGSTVLVKGHIEEASMLVTDFNGTMTANVLDTRELITCRQNDPKSAAGFQFYDRQKSIFRGNGNVVDGKFSFAFAVPRDINYADGTGLINVYALTTDRSRQANGSDDRFYINGSEDVRNDSIGPSIYCYLNSPAFVNGGTVNATPYFVAKVTDKDGINASGSGIGHDLQLCIDSDMTRVYTLNGNFSYDFGVYTSGTTYYNIPELPEGPHTLTFRAWDLLNNSSTATLKFNVVKGLTPELLSINCTENPARNATTFIINHNFAGSNVDAIVDVFDMSGRLLWSRSASGISSTGTYTVDWDLVLDNGGKLQTGVYLYRVRLGSDGSGKASKAKKLIVISNN